MNTLLNSRFCKYTFSSFNILNEKVLRLQAARSQIPINCGFTGCQLKLRNSVLIFTFCAGYELSRCSFFSVTQSLTAVTLETDAV